MCENHDGLSHRSISEQRRLRSPSVDEQETELEPSLEQDEEENMDHGPKTENDSCNDGSISPSRKKEIMVVKIFFFTTKLWKKKNFFLKICEIQNVINNLKRCSWVSLD